LHQRAQTQRVVTKAAVKTAAYKLLVNLLVGHNLKPRPSSSTTAARAVHLPSIRIAVRVRAAMGRVLMELAARAKALAAVEAAGVDVELRATLNRQRMPFLRELTATIVNKVTWQNHRATSQRVSLWQRSLKDKTIS